MKKIFNDLINGNLTAAKKGAKNYSVASLKNYGQDCLGYNEQVAETAAHYLKGLISFQEYCDIEFANQ